MAGYNDNIGTTARIVVWLSGLLIGLTSSEDLRLRYVIARTASQARAKQSKSRAE